MQSPSCSEPDGELVIIKQFVKNTVREHEQVPASRFRVQFINRQAANKTLKNYLLQNEKQKRIPCSLSHLIPRPPRTVRVVSLQFFVWLVVFLVVDRLKVKEWGFMRKVLVQFNWKFKPKTMLICVNLDRAVFTESIESTIRLCFGSALFNLSDWFSSNWTNRDLIAYVFHRVCMNLFRVLLDHWIVWIKVGFPTLASNQDQNQKLSHAGYLLPISCPWHRLHISCAWYRLQVFPRLLRFPVCSCLQLIIRFPRLVLVAYCRFELVSLRYFVYINDNSHTYHEQYKKTLELGITRTASWILRNRTLK